MKKLLSFTIVFSIVFGFILPNMTNIIYAESIDEDSEITVIENLDWSSLGFSSVKITYRKYMNDNNTRSIFIADNPLVEIDYIIENTGETVHFERYGDVGFLYIDNQLFTTIEFGSQSLTRSVLVSVPNDLLTLSNRPANAPEFSNFYYTHQNSWRIDDFKNKFLDEVQSYVVTSILTAIIGAAASFPAFVVVVANITLTANEMYSKISIVPDLASILESDDLPGVNFYYQSFVNQCDILAWYGMSAHTTKNNNIGIRGGFIQNQRHTWNGHPDDYTQPAACRVLANKYS